MRRLNWLIVAAVAACVVPAGGCRRGESGTAVGAVAPLLPERNAKKKGSGTASQEAIVRVLDEDKQALKAGFDGLRADSQPSAVVKMAGEFVDQREQADVTGCPAEFRSARTKYLKAWTALKATLAKYPDAYDDVDFMNSLADAFGKGRSKSRKLGGGVADAVKHLTDAYAEVYAAAEGYGVDVGGK